MSTFQEIPNQPGVPWPNQTLVKRKHFTEVDWFVLEAAQQLGFVTTDDDEELYACSDESIVELVRRARRATESGSRPLSQAYLRLRALIPGAFRTPYAPTAEQVWDTTEKALIEMKLALLELAQCDGSSNNVTSATILAARVRGIALKALGR
jgi:gentisate 1,2-dioxygenase